MFVERNYGWVIPENLFEKASKPPKCKEGFVHPFIENVNCIYEKLDGNENYCPIIKHNDTLENIDEKT